MSARRRASATRNFYIILAVVAVVGIAVIGYQVMGPEAAPTATTVADVGSLEAEGYLMGSAEAPVQVVEFGDFACPVCAQWAVLTGPDVKKRLVETGQVAFRYLDFPLNIPGHQNSPRASLAAACANEQGKFWEMHDAIYMRLEDWVHERNPKGVFERAARDLGLDMRRWEECYDTARYAAQIEANRLEGERRGVSGTPTFFIGNRRVSGAISYDRFKALVDSVAAEQPARGAAAGSGAAGDAAGGAGAPAGAR